LCIIGDVIQVKAVDLDAPGNANSKIIYSIQSGNKDKFFIDSASGVIRINENSNLDRDLFGSFYTLKIAASDFGSMNPSALDSNSTSIHSNSSAESFCFVTIKVLDVNNKTPKFATYPE